jgi:hypothetical protein
LYFAFADEPNNLDEFSFSPFHRDGVASAVASIPQADADMSFPMALPMPCDALPTVNHLGFVIGASCCRWKAPWTIQRKTTVS